MRISGFEEWTFGDDGLVAQSKGHTTRPSTTGSSSTGARGTDDVRSRSSYTGGECRRDARVRVAPMRPRRAPDHAADRSG